MKVLDFIKSGGPDWTKSRNEADSLVTPSLGMGMVYVSVASSPVTSMPSTKISVIQSTQKAEVLLDGGPEQRRIDETEASIQLA